MPSIRQAFRNWVSQRNAEGMILFLSKSPDPQATLLAYRRSINDDVIEELLTHSLYISSHEGLDKGLQWLELAHQASLLGGSAQSLAKCLEARAVLLLDIYEDLNRRRGNDDFLHQVTEDLLFVLDDALECGLNALEIYQETKNTEDIPIALGLISKIYHAKNKFLPAFEYRLLSIVAWAKRADAADATLGLINNLVGLYWSIANDDLKSGAQLLLEHAGELEGAIVGWIDEKRRGDLFDILADAFRQLSQQEKAFHYWEEAAKCYRQSAAQKDEFLTLARLQDYAARLGQEERAVAYGEAAISVTPPNIDAADLANCHHILAGIYANIIPGRELNAISALHRAAELYSQNKEMDYIAGQCLLQAATLEEDLEMIDEAQKDLEQCLTFSGGQYTYWFTYQTLARLWWRQRGDLGMALKYATDAEQYFFLSLSLATRAAALWLSGNLFWAAGDAQRAFDRFEAILKILTAQDSSEHIITIYINRWFNLFVSLPFKAEVAFLASLAAQKLGKEEEAQRYLKQHEIFTAQEADLSHEMVDEEPLQQDEKLKAVLRGRQLLARGEEFAFVNPREAIYALEEALPLLADYTQVSLAVHRTLGLARLRLGDIEEARTIFNQALQMLMHFPDAHEETICRLNLGVAEAAAGNLELAYEQIDRVLRLTEAHRTNLVEEDQRLLLLENYLHIYTIFLGICIRLHFSKRALETVEMVKSRVFVDLLAQPQRRAIDYRILSEMQELKSRRERMMLGESLLETWSARSSKFESLYQVDPEKAKEWLEAPFNLDKHIKTLEEQAQSQQLHLKLESQAETLKFDDICALCRAT